MTHDPQVYPDPFKFNPERFLGPKPQQDPRDISFGFGRRYDLFFKFPFPRDAEFEKFHRICPGQSSKDQSIFNLSIYIHLSFLQQVEF